MKKWVKGIEKYGKIISALAASFEMRFKVWPAMFLSDKDPDFRS